MFLLDTNVVSELRKARSGKAERNVVTWAASVPTARLYISVITVLELEVGIRSLERKDARQGSLLRTWMDGHVMTAFAGRILPIDTSAAVQCAALHVPDPRAERDALIAATALVHGMTIATRNTADFATMGVALIDPWKASAK